MSDVARLTKPADRGAWRARHEGPQLHIARSIAHVLDTWRIEPIVGLLLPALGDVLSGLCGLAIIVLAATARVPVVTLARMLLNLSLDTLLGAVPLIGDAFDFWFQANTRNVALFERASERGRATVQDCAVLVCAFVGFLTALALPVALFVFVVVRAVQWAY